MHTPTAVEPRRQPLGVTRAQETRRTESHLTASLRSTVTDVLLDTEQVAALLQLRPNTLAQWRVKGAGPRFVNVGRRIRYRQADVAAWIDERTKASTSPVHVGTR